MPTPRNIEGLLFDLGGVLIEIDFERALRAWNQWTLLSIEELRQRFKMDEAYEKHERGEIEAPEYFTHLRKMLELEANDSEIILGMGIASWLFDVIWVARKGAVNNRIYNNVLGHMSVLPVHEGFMLSYRIQF